MNKMTFEEQIEAYGAIVPDCPVDLPCYLVNRTLWQLYKRLDPKAQEHPVMTEQEIVRRFDLLFMGLGTC